MRRNLFLFFTIFIMITTFMAFLIFMYYKSHQQPVIETNSGKIIGTIVNRLDKRVYCYFGVPYAEPPINELRFAKPKPKESWKGILRAVKQPNYCWQTTYHTNSIKNQEIFKAVPDWRHFYENDRSEDCLYLNIYVPDTQQTNLTVMVWIYGGSFQSGSISLTSYDGSIMAAKEDVIVVAINYRLGIFGFLVAEDSDLSGNYGLYDQVLALQWIKDNIQSFGGNPNNIVLFGESAGAISVGYHLISPLSEKLFSRAILQSGNPVVPIILLSKQTQTEAAVKVVKLANCPLPQTLSDNSSQPLDENSISCLRQKDPSFLYELSKKAFPQGRGAFVPIEANEFFAEHPIDLVKKRLFNSNKEIMIGTNPFEGAHFAKYGPFSRYWNWDKIDVNFTKEGVIELLNKTIPEQFNSIIQDTIDFALSDLTDNSDAVQVWNRFIQIVGDIIFVCSDFQFINEYSASNRSVYYYQFRHKPTYNSWGPKWATGAVHGEEIQFVFGIPLILQKMYTLEEIKLSEKVVNVWTNFAKTGKASTSKQWPQYKEDKPVYMSFEVNETLLLNGFPGFKCEEYYETLMSEVRNYFKQGNEVPA